MVVESCQSKPSFDYVLIGIRVLGRCCYLGGLFEVSIKKNVDALDEMASMRVTILCFVYLWNRSVLCTSRRYRIGMCLFEARHLSRVLLVPPEEIKAKDTCEEFDQLVGEWGSTLHQFYCL